MGVTSFRGDNGPEFVAIPLPDSAIRVDFDAQFSHEQFQRICRGFIGDQDYKWFFYFEAPWLYIYRGGHWVGQCWYFLKFEPFDDGYRVAEAWVESESLQWLEQSPSKVLYQLIDDYLPSSNKYVSLMDDGLGSYQILRKGCVKLEISTNSMSVVDVKELGSRLIQLADQLSSSSAKP